MVRRLEGQENMALGKGIRHSSERYGQGHVEADGCARGGGEDSKSREDGGALG